MTDALHPASLLADARAAARSVARSPRLFLLLAVVIGLGVGATTAVFALLNPLLVAPLPFEEPDALVWVANTGEGESLSAVTSRTGNLRDFRERAESFTGLTGYDAFYDQSRFTLAGTGRPEQTTGVGVAHDFLDVLGVEPGLGRSFTEAEGQSGAPGAVILTDGFWRSRFAANPAVVGTSVSLDGEPRTVVGVLPPSFDFASVFHPGRSVDFLHPFPIDERTDGRGNTLAMVGRLAPGATPATAQAELDAIVAGLQREDPDRWGLGARVTPLREQLVAPFRTALLLLAASAATVLIIVCVNVATVLLARSPRRSREIAIRKAMGATRGRIVRQLVFESLFLGLAGGGLGLALATAATGLVAGTGAIAIPMLDRVRVDAAAGLVGLAVALLAGIAAGLVPALQVADGRESSTLRAAPRGSSQGRSGRRLRETLVVAELALACLLLVAGGLLLRSFSAVLDTDLGFTPERTVAWQLDPSIEFETAREFEDFVHHLTGQVEAVAGVESAGLIDALPLGRNRAWTFRLPGDAEDRDARLMSPHLVGPGYFETLRVPVREGRALTTFDGPFAPPVVLIGETAARRLFPGGSAVGRQILFGGVPREIVGVVGDVRHLSPETPAGTQVYFPLVQVADFRTLDLVVRSSLAPAALASAVSATLAGIDPGMPTREYWTVESTVDRAVSSRRFTLQVVAAFGAIALLLAALGIYGVLAQSVAERTREFGIRMALGATRTDVRRDVVRRTLILASLGVTTGLAVALPGTRLLASLLYGVQPLDPATLAGVVGVLIAVALLSGWTPAVRAARSDRGTVLRGQ